MDCHVADAAGKRYWSRESDYEPRLPELEDGWQAVYETPERWLNYGLQIQAVLETAPESVLEVGIGTGTVSSLLRSRGIAVTTLDIDPRAGPDIVGSVHELTEHVPPKSVDTVLCAEVLEHLPFELLAVCCQQLAAVARRYVIIGLPRCIQPYWEVAVKLRLPWLGYRELNLGIPFLPRWAGPTPDHYWSVDFRPYTLDVVSQRIGEALDIEDTLFANLDPFHFVFVCRPRAATPDASAERGG